MQTKSDHLIRQVVEIQPLELHSLWDFFQMQNYTLHGTDHLIRQVVEIQPLELHSLWDFFQTQNYTLHGTEGVYV